MTRNECVFNTSVATSVNNRMIRHLKKLTKAISKALLSVVYVFNDYFFQFTCL